MRMSLHAVARRPSSLFLSLLLGAPLTANGWHVYTLPLGSSLSSSLRCRAVPKRPSSPQRHHRMVSALASTVSSPTSSPSSPSSSATATASSSASSTTASSASPSDASQRKRGWLKKVFGYSKSRSSSSAGSTSNAASLSKQSLHMRGESAAVMDEIKIIDPTESVLAKTTSDFLRRSFERETPSTVFSTTPSQLERMDMDPDSSSSSISFNSQDFDDQLLLEGPSSPVIYGPVFPLTPAELAVMGKVQKLAELEAAVQAKTPVLPRKQRKRKEMPLDSSRPADAHEQDDDSQNDNDEAQWDGGSPLTRLTRSWAEKIVTRLLDRWTHGEHENLVVKCGPTGNPMDLARGQFRCDASVDMDRIVFPCLRLSGGRLEARRLALNLWTFFAVNKKNDAPRYPNQFDFLAHNATFTQDDLFQSRCIRNGLRRLLTRILQNRGIRSSTVTITSIDILPSGKLSVQGEANTPFGGGSTGLSFEVRTHLAHTSRGHVVTFPGLEIALHPPLGIFVPVLPELSLDLGHNAQILALQVHGRAQPQPRLQLSARATITPHHTLKLRQYSQPSQSFAASFSVDVGKWLTGIGNFTN